MLLCPLLLGCLLTWQGLPPLALHLGPASWWRVHQLLAQTLVRYHAGHVRHPTLLRGHKDRTATWTSAISQLQSLDRLWDIYYRVFVQLLLVAVDWGEDFEAADWPLGLGGGELVPGAELVRPVWPGWAEHRWPVAVGWPVQLLSLSTTKSHRGWDIIPLDAAPLNITTIVALLISSWCWRVHLDPALSVKKKNENEHCGVFLHFYHFWLRWTPIRNETSHHSLHHTEIKRIVHKQRQGRHQWGLWTPPRLCLWPLAHGQCRQFRFIPIYSYACVNWQICFWHQQHATRRTLKRGR